MSGRTGLISAVWKAVRKSFGRESTANSSASARMFVGEDVYGNKYYEQPQDKEKNVRGKRWLEPLDTQAANEIPETPIEWESWLRGRRSQPPTQKEIDMNVAKMMFIQQKSREREGTKKTPEDDVVKKPTTNFPVYEEFEVKPGDKSHKDGDR